jgi:uncharacterized membrane protein YraQ (UPF0718 family)
MSDSGSSSSSSSSTEQTNEDNKVTATEGGVALGKDAQLSYVNQLGPEAAKVVEDAFKLAKEAGLVALGLHQQTVEFQNQALEAASQRATRAEEVENFKDTIIFKDVLPWLVGGTVIFGLINVMGGKK